MSYILVHRLLNGLPTIFQAERGVNYYFFNHDGVSLIPVGTVGTAHTATRDHRVWALIDTKPDPSLWSATCWLIIQASSPQVENYKQFRKHANAQLIYMDVWSWWELRAAQYADPRL